MQACSWLTRTNVRQVGMVTVAAAEGLVRVQSYGIVVPSSVPFVLDGGPASVFVGKDSMVDSKTSGIMVLSQGGLLVMVDVTGTKRFFQTVLVLLLWCHSVVMISGEFTIQCDFGRAMILKA